MRGDFIQTMLPMAPQATMSVHSKPKVDFSIESIVGKDAIDDKGEERSTENVAQRIPGLSTPPPAHSNKVSSSFYKDYEGSALRRAEVPYGSRTVPGPHPGMLGHPRLNYSGVLQYATEAVPSLYQPHFPSLSPYYVGRDFSNYPWIMPQSRIIPYRPQGAQGAGFILQQFRKPKRNRTAFSPSQLLTLERAFEKNHYVVGAERKQLAQDLSLSETQVKVWFQNRRTKHKRQKQEEEQQTENPTASQSDGQTQNKDSEESDCESRDSSDTSEPPDYPRN